MKFNRRRLIAVVEKEIKTRESEYEKVLSEVRDSYAKAQKEWLESHHPAELKKAAQAISKKIGRGGVITFDDVKAFNTRGETHVFNRSKPEEDYKVTRAGKPKTEALEGLLAILVAADDEFISATALRDLGYRNIAPLLRDATL